MELPKKFNEKCFIYNKTGYQAMNYKKKRKKTTQANVTKVNNLIHKVLQMNLSVVISKVKLINNH